MPRTGRSRDAALFEKVELKGVALAVDADGGLDLAAIKGRVDIVSAADDESVEVVERESRRRRTVAACAPRPATRRSDCTTT
jgi:hypothetical protein